MLDVNKVAYEMSGPFEIDGAPQAVMTAAILLKNFTKKFLLNVLIEIYYKVIAKYLFNLS